MGGPVLDYGRPARRPLGGFGWFVLLLPVICAGIIASHRLIGGADDPYWYAALGIVALTTMHAIGIRRWHLVLYCLLVGMAVLLLGIGASYSPF